MGNHAKPSVARTRLSTLAVGTSLAAVGVGVIGAGAANAAVVPTGVGTTHNGIKPAVVAPTVATINGLTVATLTATMDITGSSVDPSIAGTAQMAVDWGDGSALSWVAFDATAKPTKPYAIKGTYNVRLLIRASSSATTNTPSTTNVLQVGVTTAVPTSTFTVTPVANTLTANIDLSGVSVDPLAHAITGTIDWGDNSTKDTLSFDAATGKAIALAGPHTFPSAKTYAVTIKFNDGLGTFNSPVTVSHNVVVTGAATVAADKAKVQSVTIGSDGLTATADITGTTVDPTLAGSSTGTVDWGDSSTPTTITFGVTGAANAVAPHAYPANNTSANKTYTVTVTVKDGHTTPDPTATGTATIFPAQTQTGPPSLYRAAGNDRYETGLILSQKLWSPVSDTTASAIHAGAVVLATGNSFPDALSGVPLAAKVGGPLLLTDGKAALPDARVVAEIQRILPANASHPIYILGGTSAVSQGIQDKLAGLGYTIIRYGGADRFATSLLIAQNGMGNPTHLVVARGDQGATNNGFADALAAGPFAADVFGGGDSAVVLTNGTTVTPDMKAYIQAHLSATSINVVAVGGPAATAVASIPGAPGEAGAISGSDRYETAKLIADRFPANSLFGVSTGLAFPDALTGGAFMANLGGPLILTDPTTEPGFTSTAVNRLAAKTPAAFVFGGVNAVSASIYSNILAAIHGNAVTWVY